MWQPHHSRHLHVTSFPPTGDVAVTYLRIAVTNLNYPHHKPVVRGVVDGAQRGSVREVAGSCGVQCRTIYRAFTAHWPESTFSTFSSIGALEMHMSVCLSECLYFLAMTRG